MTQTILRDRTGGAGYWTKGCLSCVERCCEGSNGPTRASSLHSRTALPQPQNDSRLGGTVSSSTHISLPPGSFSLQITTWPLKHGQYEPPPNSGFGLLPSHANTTPHSSPPPCEASAPQLPAAGSSVFMELLLCHCSQPWGRGRASLDGQASQTLGIYT